MEHPRNLPTNYPHQIGPDLGSRERQRELDQFYTCNRVALICYEWLWSYLYPIDYLFVEPSAGFGAFSSLLPPESRAYDLDPKGDGIESVDFFEITLPYRDRIVVIGNPPFGKSARLAIKFFNHAARRAEIIAFIVPASFQKHSIQKKLHRHFHLRREWPIPDHAFLFDGAPTTVPTVFQIWEWSPEPRLVPRLPTTHDDFEFTTKDHADFALQRVGVHVGLIHQDFKRGKGSTYFIKAKELFVREILEVIDFKPLALRTAGNPSLAKTELVQLYTQRKKELFGEANSSRTYRRANMCATP